MKPIVTAQLHDNKDVCSELNKDRDNKTCGSSTEETDMNDEKTQFKGQKTSNKFDDTSKYVIYNDIFYNRILYISCVQIFFCIITLSW